MSYDIGSSHVPKVNANSDKLLMLTIVSREDCLFQVYVASVNNATSCSGGCATLLTDGSPKYSPADWLSNLEKTVEAYAHACEVQRHVENTTMWEVEYTASTMREVEYTASNTASTMREVEYTASTMREMEYTASNTASTMREVEYTASTMREVEYTASTRWEVEYTAS
jgi:hypothetical protein